jgi:hypothetical protein
LATKGQYFVRDIELRGFLILIGKHTKTFMVQGELWRDGKRQFSARLTLAECEETMTRDARVKAKEALASMSKGIRAGEAASTRPDEVTLREAWCVCVPFDRHPHAARPIGGARNFVLCRAAGSLPEDGAWRNRPG